MHGLAHGHKDGHSLRMLIRLNDSSQRGPHVRPTLRAPEHAQPGTP